MKISETKFAAVVLAAGMSRRMGTLKPLLPFGDKPMLARVVETLMNAQAVSPIIVVTGNQRERIENALQNYDVQFAHNANYENGGMLSSVQSGVRALPPQTSFLLVLGDQPAVQTSTIKVLCAQPQDVKIVLPTCNGKRGHPVRFHHSCVEEILALGEENTLKDVVRKHHQSTLMVNVDDNSILEDVDTLEDYQRVLQKWQINNS